MSNLSHPSLAAGPRLSSTPPKRRKITRETRGLLYRALYELDPFEADAKEAELTSSLINIEDRRADEIGVVLKHERYRRLTPYRATALFAELYQDMFDLSGEHEQISGLEAGLEEASLANFLHIWRARQQADVLGMEYTEYLAAVFLTNQALGSSQLPRPSDLHGSVAAASAALALHNLRAVAH